MTQPEPALRPATTIDLTDRPAPTGAPARVVLRPIASTLPIGFLGLFIGTLSFSAFQLRWIEADQAHVVALSVLVTTVPMQAVAAIGGLLARDVVVTTAMATLSVGWTALAVTTLTHPTGSTSAGVGVPLVAVAACLTACAVAAGTKLVAAAVLGTAAVRFGFTAAYELTGAGRWQHTSGIIGAVLAGLAFYAAAAALLEGAYRRPVLPMLRLGPGRRAQRGALDDQLAGLAHEPGVRVQL